MKPRARAALLLKIGVTVSLLGYLASRLDWQDLGRILKGIEIGRFAAAVAVLGGTYALTAVRWQFLLIGQGLAIRLRSIFSIDLVAAFFNSFLPGSTGGDAMRVYYASALVRGELTRLVASVVMDRLIGLSVLLTFGYFAFLLRPTIAARFELLQDALHWLPLVLAGVFAGCAVLLLMPRDRLPGVFARAIERASRVPVVGRLIEFGRHLRRKPHFLFFAVVTTVIAQLVGFFAAFLVARSIGLALDYPETMLVMAITQTAVSLPISVAGHGVREVVLIGVFSAMGIVTGRPEVAIAFSILLFSAQLFWSLLGGIWFAIRPRHRKL